MSLEEFLAQVKDIREYKRAQAVKLDLETYPRKLTAQVLSVSVNFVSKWTPVPALVGGPRVQYNRHGAQGLRLTHKGSKQGISVRGRQAAGARVDPGAVTIQQPGNTGSLSGE